MRGEGRCIQRDAVGLDQVVTSWRPLVRSARKRLADQARARPLTPFDEVERSPNGSFAWTDPVEVIGIDIPIGHVPGGSRRADVEARRFGSEP